MSPGKWKAFCGHCGYQRELVSLKAEPEMGVRCPWFIDRALFRRNLQGRVVGRQDREEKGQTHVIEDRATVI